MKKNNALVLTAATLFCAFLLWLWFRLEFNHIDAPTDLVLSVIWWALIALACAAFIRSEKKRRERIRTCFVGEHLVYNSETGAINVASPEEAADSIRDIIEVLEYGNEMAAKPRNAQFSCVVRTASCDERTWKGEVEFAERAGRPIPFNGRDELVSIIASKGMRAA